MVLETVKLLKIMRVYLQIVAKVFDNGQHIKN